MKRKVLLFTVIAGMAIFSMDCLQAQSVAINTDGSAAQGSAILDIKSITKGLLPPRMTTLQRSAITSPAAGLLVFDTNSNSFWFYSGSAWSNLSASATPGWLLTGNSATNPATHFIGTSDNQPLRFKVNNVWAGEIHPSTGNLFLGINAGKGNTSGLLNTALGIAALNNNSSGNENVAIGDSSLYAQNAAVTNVAVGTHALYKNTIGNANTAIGPYALVNNVDGGFNTSTGVNSLANNISGTENVATGSRALQFNLASFNTATGASALRFNSSGSYNTASGYQALYSNTSNGNTAAGYRSLYANTSGNISSAFGFSALLSNTTGNDNNAFGYNSLALNTTASGNVAIGNNALSFQAYDGGIGWISGNVAVGNNALYHNNPASNTDGNYNTAVGYNAMYTNTTGFNNAATGKDALYSNTSGYVNTAVGVAALYSNTTGYLNTATGNSALYANTNGAANTANGISALYHTTTGGNNTAVGFKAIFSNVSGNSNTAIGAGALDNLVGGTKNIAIGYNSGTDAGSPNVTNTISIGNDGILNAASNQAFFGNLSTTWNGGNKTWSTYSDERMKTNITPEVKGLDFILRLHPVTYNRSIRAILKITGGKDTKDFPGKYDVEKIKESGFLAQEVEQAAQEARYDFSGVGIPQQPNQLYTLSYEQFVVPLVKAVQEQQLMIKDQQQLINLLAKRLELLEKNNK
jgi:hypothetical protein